MSYFKKALLVLAIVVILLIVSVPIVLSMNNSISPIANSIEDIIYNINDKDFSSSDLIRITSYQDLLFVEQSNQGEWLSNLYTLSQDNDNNKSLHRTGISGNKELFEFEIIAISQGEFVAAYCASHMGNGTLSLFPLSDLDTAKYEIPAIDRHFESQPLIDSKDDMSNYIDEGLLISEVLLDGKLCSEYNDVNDDGDTDIILTGIKQIYIEGKGSQILAKEYYIKSTYLYDKETNQFIYNKDFSIELPIESGPNKGAFNVVERTGF